MIKRIVCLKLALAILLSTPAVFSGEPSQRMIRVSIIEGKPFVNIKLTGPYVVTACDTDAILKVGDSLVNTRVMPTNRGILFGEELLLAKHIKIKAEINGSTYVNDVRYKGEIALNNNDKGLRVVNSIELEEYLCGVLPGEAHYWWPFEILKAQAIVARTYALYQSYVNKKWSFDLTDNSFSQIYKGKGIEKLRTNKAVSATKGKVLAYKGRIFPAYFHSTCAGHTEDAGNLWDIDLEPLKGVACQFCRRSPHYYWKRKISKRQLMETLEKSGYKITDIEKAEVLDRNISGRIKKIKFTDHKSVETELTITEFKNAMEQGFIRAANFNVKIIGDYIEFAGLGWGHGAGMCQWGGYAMAQKGSRYDDILMFYYPGAEIMDKDQAKGYYVPAQNTEKKNNNLKNTK